MSTATFFTSLAVAVLAAAALALLRLYGAEGFIAASSSNELDAARGVACLLTIF